MIEDILRTLVLQSLRDRVFFIVAAATLAFLLLSVFMAVGTIWLHYRQDRNHQLWSAVQTELEPMVLDVLAGDRPPEDVWRMVDTADGLRFTDFLIQRYAYKVTGHELEAMKELARPYLDQVSRRVDDFGPEVRAQSFQSLAILGSADYGDLAVRALGDPSPAVALVAARALAHSEGARYLREILDSLDRFELWSSGFLSVMIASMGPAAVPALSDKYLDRAARPEVRAMAAEALRLIGVPEAANLAAEVLEGLGVLPGVSEDGETLEADAQPAFGGGEVTKFGEERELRISSLRILSELGHAGHLPLARALIHDVDPVVRAFALSALGEIGEEEDVPRLVSAFDDPSRWVAVHAAQSLRAMGAFDAIDALARTHPSRADLALEVAAG